MNAYENKLEGTWTIIATNFPMWTTGKRTNPQITYKKIRQSPLKFKDTVCYKQKTQIKRIIGIDTFEEGIFSWRGSGFLKLLKSKWFILYIDEQLLVIQFEKSMVTPAGVDILLRSGSNQLIDKTFIEEKYKKKLAINGVTELIWLIDI